VPIAPAKPAPHQAAPAPIAPAKPAPNQAAPAAPAKPTPHQVAPAPIAPAKPAPHQAAPTPAAPAKPAPHQLSQPSAQSPSIDSGMRQKLEKISQTVEFRTAANSMSGHVSKASHIGKDERVNAGASRGADKNQPQVANR
jgi:hypothetical protein